MFNGCHSLKSVTISSSITSIKYRAFQDCNALETIYYSGSKEQWDAIEIEDFYNDPLLNAKIIFGSYD